MDELLTAYDHADRAVGIRGRRWLITHANFTSAGEPRPLPRAGRRGRPPAGLALEGHADPAEAARPRADGVVPPVPQVARRGRRRSAAAATT